MYLLISNDDDLSRTLQALQNEQNSQQSAGERVRVLEENIFREDPKNPKSNFIGDKRITIIGHGSQNQFGTMDQIRNNTTSLQILNPAGKLIDYLINDANMPKTVQWIDIFGCDIGLVPPGGVASYAEKFIEYLHKQAGYEHIQVRTFVHDNSQSYARMLVRSDPQKKLTHWNIRALLLDSKQNEEFKNHTLEINKNQGTLTTLKIRLGKENGQDVKNNELIAKTKIEIEDLVKKIKDLISAREAILEQAKVAYPGKHFREIFNQKETIVSPYSARYRELTSLVSDYRKTLDDLNSKLKESSPHLKTLLGIDNQISQIKSSIERNKLTREKLKKDIDKLQKAIINRNMSIEKNLDAYEKQEEKIEAAISQPTSPYKGLTYASAKQQYIDDNFIFYVDYDSVKKTNEEHLKELASESKKLKNAKSRLEKHKEELNRLKSEVTLLEGNRSNILIKQEKFFSLESGPIKKVEEELRAYENELNDVSQKHSKYIQTCMSRQKEIENSDKALQSSSTSIKRDGPNLTSPIKKSRQDDTIYGSEFTSNITADMLSEKSNTTLTISKPAWKQTKPAVDVGSRNWGKASKDINKNSEEYMNNANKRGL